MGFVNSLHSFLLPPPSVFSRGKSKSSQEIAVPATTEKVLTKHSRFFFDKLKKASCIICPESCHVVMTHTHVHTYTPDSIYNLFLFVAGSGWSHGSSSHVSQRELIAASIHPSHPQWSKGWRGPICEFERLITKRRGRERGGGMGWEGPPHPSSSIESGRHS